MLTARPPTPSALAAKYVVLLLGFGLINLAPAIRNGLGGTGTGPARTDCDTSCQYTVSGEGEGAGFATALHMENGTSVARHEQAHQKRARPPPPPPPSCTNTEACDLCPLLPCPATPLLVASLRIPLTPTPFPHDPRPQPTTNRQQDSAGNYALSTANRELYRGCDPVAGTGTYPSGLDCEALTICYECFCRASLNAGAYGQSAYCGRFTSVIALSAASQVLQRS